MTALTPSVAGRRCLRPQIDPLEPRALLTSLGPFDTPEFQRGFAALMQKDNLPEVSIAARSGTHVATYVYRNPNFPVVRPGVPTADTALFRLGSISKIFAASVIMKQIERGDLSLDSRAFQLLGYFRPDGTPIRQYGFDPVTGRKVSFLPAPDLWSVRVRSLLNMSSGLPMQVPVTSQSFPSTDGKPVMGQVIDTVGSYAGLAYAGPGPYLAPATNAQQVAFYTYSFTTHDLKLEKPGTYKYSDTGYAVIGAVAQAIAKQRYGLDYMGFLSRFLLRPMGIAAPQANPRPGIAMVGLASTLQSKAFPTEVAYYPPARYLPRISVIPDPARTEAPFYSSTLVSQAYGGWAHLPSHFAEGGLVANPLALTRFFGVLYAAGKGDSSGPLSPGTVRTMVSPANGTRLPVPSGSLPRWFGLGWLVYATPANSAGAAPQTQPPRPGNWVKDGGLPGTSTLLVQDRNGKNWSYTFNTSLTQAQKSAVQNLITTAIAGWKPGSD